MMKPFRSDVVATPSSLGVDGQLALTDRLFAALDAIRIGGPRGDWITEVRGIHTIAGERWVQIAAQANARRTLLLTSQFGDDRRHDQDPSVLVAPAGDEPLPPGHVVPRL